SRIDCSTRFLVFAATIAGLFKYLDTVATETFADFATSCIVTIVSLLSYVTTYSIFLLYIFFVIDYTNILIRFHFFVNHFSISLCLFFGCSPLWKIEPPETEHPCICHFPFGFLLKRTIYYKTG